jgi:hypothetical protein
MQVRYYYRIRQVDLDLQVDYSALATVEGITNEGSKSASRWAVTPNPVVQKVLFTQQDTKTDGTRVLEAVLTSAAGNRIFGGSGTLEELNERIQRVMDTLGAGVYILQLSDGSYQEKFRLVHL